MKPDCPLLLLALLKYAFHKTGDPTDSIHSPLPVQFPTLTPPEDLLSGLGMLWQSQDSVPHNRLDS